MRSHFIADSFCVFLPKSPGFRQFIYIYSGLLYYNTVNDLGGSSYYFEWLWVDHSFIYLFLHISVAAIFNQIALHSIFINNLTSPGNKIIPMVIKEFSVLKHRSQVLHFLPSTVINKTWQGRKIVNDKVVWWSPTQRGVVDLFPPRIIFILQDTLKCFISFITTAVCSN